jgi:hypothetical protein
MSSSLTNGFTMAILRIGHSITGSHFLRYSCAELCENMVYECEVNRRGELLHQIFHAARHINGPDDLHNIMHSMVASEWATKLKVTILNVC